MKLTYPHAIASKVTDFTEKAQIQRNPVSVKQSTITEHAQKRNFHRTVWEFHHFYSALTGIKSPSNGSGRMENILKRDACVVSFRYQALDSKEL